MPLGARTSDLAKRHVTFEALPFSDLPGWDADDHLAAFKTFARSAASLRRVGAAPDQTKAADPRLVAIAQLAANSASDVTTSDAAKAFFEKHFTPFRVVHDGAEGLLTGYYEPVLAGSREPQGSYRIPIYCRPPDLVNLVREEERGALADAPTHARKTANGIEPYATRADIETGALAGQGLEFLWLTDPVDAFFMHVQGSGRIRLPDGNTIRITYDGKNGHPYTSIGRVLIDAGHFKPEDMTLGALKPGPAAAAARGPKTIQHPRSFIFCPERDNQDHGPLGALEIPLSEGRSLAVDTAFHAIGTPVHVTVPTLCPWGEKSFQRLMIAQDVGSAIRGPERGDIYFGSGDEAGRLAGGTKHPGRFVVLLPKEQGET